MQLKFAWEYVKDILKYVEIVMKIDNVSFSFDNDIQIQATKATQMFSCSTFHYES